MRRLKQLEMNILSSWNDCRFKLFTAQELGSDFLQDNLFHAYIILHLHIASMAESNGGNDILRLLSNDARGYMGCCGQDAYRIRSLIANVKCELAIK